MSLIFSSTICLDCKQRIDVLYRCLKEWNIEMDCENILDCDDCVSCKICDFYGLDFDENGALILVELLTISSLFKTFFS
jgi:hypothetical protein